LVDTSENKLGENTMAEHPLNADGDFYVEHGCCTSCDVPMQSAPSLFAYDETSHCFVKRQPSTRAECDMMFEAIRGAELRCIRYRGTDADWYRRLVSSGDLDVCDYPPTEPVQPRIRSVVECDTQYESLDALADAFERFLKSTEMQSFHFDFKRTNSGGILLHYHRCSVTAGSYHHVGSFEEIAMAFRDDKKVRIVHQHDITLGPTPTIAKWIASDERMHSARWFTRDRETRPDLPGFDHPW
jgi:hypothetical protein